MADENNSQVKGRTISSVLMGAGVGNGGGGGSQPSSNAQQPGLLGQTAVNPVAFNNSDWNAIANDIDKTYSTDAERNAAKYQLSQIYASQMANSDNERKQLGDEYFQMLNPTEEMTGERFRAPGTNPFFQAVSNAREGLFDLYEGGGGVLDYGVDAVGDLAEGVTGNHQLGEDIRNATNAQNLAPVAAMATDTVSMIPIAGPVIGGVKGAIESSDDLYRAVMGYDPITREKLDAGQRGVAGGAAALNIGLSALPGVAVGKNMAKRAAGQLGERYIAEEAAKKAGKEAIDSAAKNVTTAEKAVSKADDDFIAATDARRRAVEEAKNSVLDPSSVNYGNLNSIAGNYGIDMRNLIPRTAREARIAEQAGFGTPESMANFYIPQSEIDNIMAARRIMENAPKGTRSFQEALDYATKQYPTKLDEAISTAKSKTNIADAEKRMANAEKELDDAKAAEMAAQAEYDALADPAVTKALFDKAANGSSTATLLGILGQKGEKGGIKGLRDLLKPTAKEAADEAGKKAGKEGGKEAGKEAGKEGAEAKELTPEDYVAQQLEEMQARRAMNNVRNYVNRGTQFLRNSKGKIAPTGIRELRKEGITGPGALRGYGLGAINATLNQMSDTGNMNAGEAIGNIYSGATERGNLLPLLVATGLGPRRATARATGSTLPYYSVKAGGMNSVVDQNNRGGAPLNEAERAYLEALSTNPSIVGARQAVLDLANEDNLAEEF